MINKKSIIILAAVLVVLIGAFFAVKYLWVEEEQTPASDDVQLTEIFTTAKENVVRIDVKLVNESFSFVYKDDKWVLENDETVSLKNSYVDYLCIDLSSVYAQECIEENASDLTKYGLDTPAGVYTITLADGTTKTFHLGNMDPVGRSYYFKMADRPVVYTIYTSKGQSLSNNLAYYRNSNILDVNTETLSRIYVKRGNDTLELIKKAGKEGDLSEYVWDMLKPIKHECDVQPIHDYIISKMSYITVKEFIDPSDERYAISGVNAPEAVIELSDDSDVRQTIYIGNADGESRYIKTNDRVYLIADDAVSFIDLSPFLYVSKFISLEHIDTVSEIEIIHNGITHTASIEGEKDNYVYKLNGTELMEDTFKEQVYQKVIGLLADEFAESPVQGTPEYTVIYHLKDGSVKRNDYCHYDDRSYAAFDKDGNCEFIIRKKKLDEMFASVDNVAAGRTAQ